MNTYNDEEVVELLDGVSADGLEVGTVFRQYGETWYKLSEDEVLFCPIHLAN